MGFLPGLFSGERWEQDNGSPAGGAGAAVQVQVPPGELATVATTGPVEATTVSTPARNDADQFTPGSGEAGSASGRPGGQQQPSGQPATTVQVTTAPAEAPPAPAGLNADQLATLRASLVEANPHAVPELIRGATFEELIASVPTAREAHQRVASQVQEAAAGSVARGGGAGGAAVDPDSLSGEAKISVGLQQNRTR